MNPRKAKLPGLAIAKTGNPQTDKNFEIIRERLEVRDGARGEPLEAAVTFRDLKDMGLSFSLGGGNRNTGPRVLMQNPDGSYTLSDAEAFAQSIYDSKLFQTLRKGINDPTRFDGLVPEEVKRLILQSIADEAAKRGADVKRVESKLQTTTDSLAYTIQEVTAAVAGAAAGVRETTYASATANQAMAGQITQVQARLDDVGGVTIEQALTAVADDVTGLHGQYTLKIGTNDAVAGFGLAIDDPISGPATSAFIVMADKFAVVSSTDLISDPANPPTNRIPFGIDTVTDTIYINGNVRINANGTTLNDLAASTGVVVSATSGIWKVDANGDPINTTITLTASLTGDLTGFVTWSRSGAGTTVPTAGTTNTWVINAADQTSDSVTYTATLVDGGVTYYDSVTINRLRDGVNAITVRLSNQTASITSLPDGTGVNYSTATGTIEAYQGLTRLASPDVSFALASGGNPNSLTYTLNTSTGAYSVTGGMTVDVAKITFQATIASTGLVVPVEFTLSKNKQGVTGADGATGADAQVMTLLATGYAYIYKDAVATTSTSPTIRFDVVRQNIPTGTVEWHGYAYASNNTYLGEVTLGGTGDWRSLSASDFNALGATTTKYVKVVATLGDLEDTVTVYRADGGADSVIMFLSNEAHTVPADASGTVTSFTGASTTVKVFRGLTDETSLWGFSKVDSGVTTTMSGTSTITVTATAMSADVGTSTITATRTGYPTMTKVFTVTKSKTGAAGTNGTNGSTGPRGSVTRYGTLNSTGSEWNSTDIATANSLVGGTPAIGDTVTLSSATKSITRYWTGSAWTNPGVVIDGNLLVTGTIAGNKLAAGDVTVDRLKSNSSGSFNGTTFALGGTASVNGAQAGMSATSPSASTFGMLGLNTASGYAMAGGTYSPTTTAEPAALFVNASNTGFTTFRTVVGLGGPVHGIDLETGTFRYGTVTIGTPPNTTTTFLRGDGQWAALNTATVLDSARLGNYVAADYFRASGLSGTAGSLVGYVTTVIAGTTVKIPYYNI